MLGYLDAVFPYLWFELDILGFFGLRRVEAIPSSSNGFFNSSIQVGRGGAVSSSRRVETA